MKNIANIAEKIMLLMMSDKAFHFLWCFLFASIWVPMGVFLALAKEAYDWFSYGKKVGLKAFAKMAIADLFFDSIGIIFAALI